jgi:hypothetical protein
MGSDRARISYNGSQQYRAVVEQQGRVTLEADVNEAQQIFYEEMRSEALDFVGPAGTPDNGYEILLPGANLPNRDFEVRPGTMYVGGLRVHLPVPAAGAPPISYLHQPDWIDPPTPAASVREFVYLHLQEQEISAIEDADLKDVALGGPDTAARLRLVQHIVRRPTQAQDCAGALAEAVADWQNAGMDFDVDTLRLLPRAELKVSFQNLAGPPDPCEPAAQGGYLDSQNQLIRIQVTAANRFVWGYDNASFLYHVERVEPDNRTLTLRPRPVDAPHQPRQNQAVEVLRSVAKLNNGEYVAYAAGLVQTLSAGYDPDTGVQLATLLPDAPINYRFPGDTPRLFLRVWEEELTFTPGTPVALGTTGIEVTLQTNVGSQFHVGDTWAFADRPSTPTEVYPQRYRADFQPAEGPRQWVCPLAVITWNNGQGRVLDDCREQFDNLVELTKRRAGCCSIVLRSEDLTGNVTLQSILDRFSAGAKVTVSLMPGDYLLPEPLRLGRRHSNLTLEGCHDGAVLQAAPGHEDRFRDGLIVLTYANNVTLQRLRFRLPLVTYAVPGGRPATSGFRTLGGVAGTPLDRLHVSIGVRPLHCAELTIRDCLFRFRLVPNTPMLGVGIFAGSECWGLLVKDNRFLHDEEYRDRGPFRMLVGFLLAPSTTVRAGRSARALVLLPWLHQAEFRGNEFAGLTIAVLVYSNAGLVRFEENTVTDCYAGFWLLSLRALLFSARLFGQLTVNRELLLTAASFGRSVYAMVYDPVIQLAGAVARSYPLPDGFDTRGAVVVEQPASVVREEPSVDTRYRPTYARIIDRALRFWGSIIGVERAELEIGAAAAPPEVDLSVTAERWGLRASALHLRMAALERAAVRKAPNRRAISLSLHVANNHIGAVDADGLSGTGLVVLDTDLDTQSTLEMTANHIRTRSAFAPAAFVGWVERCAITGNLILNEEPLLKLDVFSTFGGAAGPISLSLFPGTGSPIARGLQFAAVAVTGNLFQGRPILPPRQPFNPAVPAPMNTWEFMNTVI